jgi:hypothetical protein
MDEQIINKAKQEAKRLADFATVEMADDFAPVISVIWNDVYARVLAEQLDINLDVAM